MSYSIRRLDPVTDEALYATMYTWLTNAPLWLREATEVFNPTDWESYYAGASWDRRIDIGIFTGVGIVACVTLTLVAVDTYEVHLEAAPTTDLTLIIAAGCEIRNQLFDVYGAHEAFMWMPAWNRPVQRINKALGFTMDNVKMFRGTSHGKLIEWERYSLRSTNGRNQN